MDFDRDQGGRAPREARPPLLLGPGRPYELQRLLQGSSATKAIVRLGDLSELLSASGGEAVLDGNLVPLEDLGILKRALSARDMDLILLGGDPATGTLRELLKHPRVRWLPYPPDSEELALLIGTSTRHPVQETPIQSAEPAPAPPPPSVTPSQQSDPALAEIEAILSQPAEISKHEELSNAPPIEAPVPQAGATEEEVQLPTVESRPEQHTNEPPWFKDQVADLANLVQVIYSSTISLQENGQAEAPPNLYADALRLVQFTRTLGYLAAPPARGETELDLSELSEELLRSAGAASDAPRFLLRTAEPLTVRANKELLIQAMDAILVLSKLCAGPEGTVRLSGERDSEGWVTLLLSFPSGPLGDLSPEEIVVPYALRPALPDMGRNALRAATRIIEGQGGELELARGAEDELRFRLTLPPA